MKAIAIESYGAPEVLQMHEMPVPVPLGDEVLIRITVCGVNPADTKWRVGMFAQLVPLKFPYIPGYDVAGTVERGGSLPPGTRVVAMLDNQKGGAYAQFAVVSEKYIAQIADGLDDETAAAIPTPALTGVQIVDEHVVPRAGERVLITGATGAVGRFALHAAKARGAYVIAAVRDSQRSLARELGADETSVLGAVPSEGWTLDHVIDTVGGAAVGELCKRVRPGGKIRTAATTPIPIDGLSSAPEFVAVRPDGRRLAAILGAVAVGEIAVPIANRFPLARAADAHRLLEAGGVGGKIVLRIPSDPQ